MNEEKKKYFMIDRTGILIKPVSFMLTAEMRVEDDDCFTKLVKKLEGMLKEISYQQGINEISIKAVTRYGDEQD